MLYQLVIKMSLIKQNIFLFIDLKYLLHSHSYGRNILRREDGKDKGFKAHFGGYLVLNSTTEYFRVFSVVNYQFYFWSFQEPEQSSF